MQGPAFNLGGVAVVAFVFVAACASNGPDTQSGPVRTTTPEELALGKQVYDAHCARCHGRDGKDDSYPFIATLDGIGNRLTVDEILEATWATGFVSPRRFTPGEQRALGKYVATL